MGRVRNSRRRTRKNKEYKKGIDTKRRPRDVDQIQDDIAKEAELGKKMEFEYDEDLPGLGQFYCTQCGRHFGDQSTLDIHTDSKLHKRRLRTLAIEQYTQDEAERAAGKTKEVLPPAHGPRPGSMEEDA
mmetsp:Transcript_56289/g.98803  ORF Transcript_56289/g.98803 Transcript_56289/m.98803 type:complete len:129 (-) Transcript_56289:117-503(-)|eukprot:CAMPEP_0184988734 /NCGR_PEP_ID=MMETSP1098-20130426/25389_1 /TAXON_ID=89044 /ORGANISM="Spumella elongata, Strain CCAP 955/1" /LENGTH=128 /DNA_ID=CAMNT_0027513563 /DNA_START=69 /DNA_END=455 /DNA_ORIENTATION=-